MLASHVISLSQKSKNWSDHLFYENERHCHACFSPERKSWCLARGIAHDSSFLCVHQRDSNWSTHFSLTNLIDWLLSDVTGYTYNKVRLVFKSAKVAQKSFFGEFYWTSRFSANSLRFCSDKKQCFSKAECFNIFRGNLWPKYPFNQKTVITIQ